MSGKIDAIRSFATMGFNRLGRATKDLKEEQLDWRYCPQANNIRWILTHISSELHVFIPEILTGNKEYKPEGWPEDHVGNPKYSLQKIMGDIEKGKANLMKSLDELTEEELAEELDWFYGKRKKEFYLMLAISEIHHHEGQIAAILGVESRMKGKK